MFKHISVCAVVSLYEPQIPMLNPDYQGDHTGGQWRFWKMITSLKLSLHKWARKYIVHRRYWGKPSSPFILENAVRIYCLLKIVYTRHKHVWILVLYSTSKMVREKFSWWISCKTFCYNSSKRLKGAGEMPQQLREMSALP